MISCGIKNAILRLVGSPSGQSVKLWQIKVCVILEMNQVEDQDWLRNMIDPAEIPGLRERQELNVLRWSTNPLIIETLQNNFLYFLVHIGLKLYPRVTNIIMPLSNSFSLASHFNLLGLYLIICKNKRSLPDEPTNCYAVNITTSGIWYHEQIFTDSYYSWLLSIFSTRWL